MFFIKTLFLIKYRNYDFFGEIYLNVYRILIAIHHSRTIIIKNNNYMRLKHITLAQKIYLNNKKILIFYCYVRIYSKSLVLIM